MEKKVNVPKIALEMTLDITCIPRSTSIAGLPVCTVLFHTYLDPSKNQYFTSHVRGDATYIFITSFINNKDL